MPEPQSPDPVTDMLTPLPMPAEVKARLWDAYHQSTSADDLTTRLKSLPGGDDLKAKLWDLKSSDHPAPTAGGGDAFLNELNAVTSNGQSQQQGGGQASPSFLSTMWNETGPKAVIKGAPDFLRGAAAGLISSGVHGGDLIRRAVGMERIIDKPDVQAAMTAPASDAGQAGKAVEQAAEYIRPTAAVTSAVKGAPWLLRMAAEGLATSGVAGMQSGGDPKQMAIAAATPAMGSVALKGAGVVGRAIQRTAAGAQEGGLGGAIASAVRTTAPQASTTMITQGLKPSSAAQGWNEKLALALPEIKAVEQSTGQPITTLQGFTDAVKQAKQSVMALYKQMSGPAADIGTQVDLNPVADAIVNSIPRKLELESPEAAQAIRDLADKYRGKFNIDDAEQLRREVNAELSAYYDKFPAARRTAATANPETSRLVAQVNALRTAIDTTLDAPGQGAASKELMRRYGALMEVENAAQRRMNVAARQAPESLSEQVGKVRAAADIARGAWRLAHGDIAGVGDIAAAKAGSSVATFLKEQQTSDALIRRGMQSHKGLPAAIELPPKPVIRGLLGPGATPLGPRTVGGLDPSDVPGITVRGEYGGNQAPSLVRVMKGPEGKWNVMTMTGQTLKAGIPTRQTAEAFARVLSKTP